MDTNRLSKSIATALNAQITTEAHASQIYLSYAAWTAKQGFNGISHFLFRHAQEERNHMMKIIEYILKRGGEVQIAAIPAPEEDPTSINACFEKLLKHEIDNTKSIYKLVKISFDEEDWATWNMMQWFVKEQIEEETIVMNLLDKIKIAGGEKASGNMMYSFDKDLENKPGEAGPVQVVPAEHN